MTNFYQKKLHSVTLVDNFYYLWGIVSFPASPRAMFFDNQIPRPFYRTAYSPCPTTVESSIRWATPRVKGSQREPVRLDGIAAGKEQRTKASAV